MLKPKMKVHFQFNYSRWISADFIDTADIFFSNFKKDCE